MSRLPRAFSQVEEDYLKAIFLVLEKELPASTTHLSRQMGTTPAAVTKTLKNLAERSLILYTPYHGARLTEAGRRVALEVIRHHRLLELYLCKALGYSWDEVDAEAERLEHHISEEFEQRIEEALDYPNHDPHGHPIPTRDGTMPPAFGFPLIEALYGDDLIVSRVDDREPALLRQLSQNGIKLGTSVRIIPSKEKTEKMLLSLDEEEIQLGFEAAKVVFVERKKTSEAIQ